MQRRSFLKGSALAGTGLLLSRGHVLAQSESSRIEVLLDEPLGTIAPEIYGHFTEHLGGTIYGGVWVGEHSKIANEGGIRKALVEKLRRIKAPVIRWPGGCFADSYDWKDGIGPRDKRGRRTNFWAGVSLSTQKLTNGESNFDPNAFGTDEFNRFCKLAGAEPYLAANLRSLPAIDFDHWVEYCNSPAGSTTFADIRAAGGSSAPYNVKYWGVGNESWGCGGNFAPEDYASEYRRFATWVPDYGVGLRLVGSGPNDNDVHWTHNFFDKLTRAGTSQDFFGMWGWSVHHYAWNVTGNPKADWLTGKGDALQFNPTEYYEILREAYLTEQIVQDQWTTLEQYDPSHKIKLVVDEYGPWYRPGTELDPSHLLEQQITMRDAVVTAFTLDIFNRHPEKVGMAACAQLINDLNSLFFAREDKFIVSPNFHVFDMYSAHQGAQAVRAEFLSSAASYDRFGKPASFWGLKGSASLRGKTLTVTVVNADVSQPRETELVLRAGRVTSAEATVLAAADVHAHNTFEQPDEVKPAAGKVEVRADVARFTCPPASVTKLTLALG